MKRCNKSKEFFWIWSNIQNVISKTLTWEIQNISHFKHTNTPHGKFWYQKKKSEILNIFRISPLDTLKMWDVMMPSLRISLTLWKRASVRSNFLCSAIVPPYVTHSNNTSHKCTHTKKIFQICGCSKWWNHVLCYPWNIVISYEISCCSD